MVRAITKCAGCGDVLWFFDRDTPPQTVVCPCGGTTLTEDGPTGGHTDPSAEEIAAAEAEEDAL